MSSFSQSIRRKLIGPQSPVLKSSFASSLGEFDVSSQNHPLIKKLALLRRSAERRFQSNQVFVVNGNFLLAQTKRGQKFSQILVPGENQYWSRSGLFPEDSEIVKVPRKILQYLRFEREFHVKSEDDGDLVCGLTEMPKIAEVDEIKTGNYLVLDSVQNPRNVGLLVDYAAKSKKFDGIIPLGSTCDFYDFKTIDASLGAVLRVNERFTLFKRKMDRMEFFKFLAVNDYLPVVADDQGVKVEHVDFKKSKALFVVVGNERNEETINQFSTRISIPMTKSLNTAAAGSILINEISRFI